MNAIHPSKSVIEWSISELSRVSDGLTGDQFDGARGPGRAVMDRGGRVPEGLVPEGLVPEEWVERTGRGD